MKDSTEILISLVMDMVDDASIDNGKIVRTLLFCTAFIALSHNVKLKTLEKILCKLYKRTGLTLGIETWLPPGEA